LGIEVYGLSYEKLLDIMREFGDANVVGKSFGVIKVRIDDIENDLSIPSKENRIGMGHKDFFCELIPHMSPEEAALRRDFTVNSMYLDLHTMELIDPFDGLNDLKSGIIRATNSKTFR
jgi:tRNA nucleotidyltransferase (CCA-adding enzyme)